MCVYICLSMYVHTYMYVCACVCVLDKGECNIIYFYNYIINRLFHIVLIYIILYIYIIY